MNFDFIVYNAEDYDVFFRGDGIVLILESKFSEKPIFDCMPEKMLDSLKTERRILRMYKGVNEIGIYELHKIYFGSFRDLFELDLSIVCKEIVEGLMCLRYLTEQVAES